MMHTHTHTLYVNIICKINVAHRNLGAGQLLVLLYTGKFSHHKFSQNGNFNNFVKNIFANDPCGQHKRRGMAVLSQNLIS